jgi:hypothetical protein
MAEKAGPCKGKRRLMWRFGRLAVDSAAGLPDIQILQSGMRV